MGNKLKNKSLLRLNFKASITIFSALCLSLFILIIAERYHQYQNDKLLLESQISKKITNIIVEEVKRTHKFIDFYRSKVADISINKSLKNHVEQAAKIYRNLSKKAPLSFNKKELLKLYFAAIENFTYRNSNYLQIVDRQGNYLFYQKGTKLFPKEKIKKCIELKSQTQIKNMNNNRYYIYSTNLSDKYYIIGQITFEKAENYLKQRILERISEQSFAQNGFFAVLDSNLNIISNYDSAKVLSLDKNSLKKYASAAKNEEKGLIFTTWDKESNSVIPREISYLKNYKDFGWIICAHQDVAVLGDISKPELKNLYQHFRNNAINYTIILVILYLMVTFIIYFTYSKTKKEFKNITSFFTKSSNLDKTIDVENLKYSEFKKLAKAVNKLLKKKNKTEKELSESNKSKERFLSIIAHDLKNPFNAILGFTDILIEDFEYLSDEEKKEYLKNVKSAAKRTLSLLEELLAWSRLQMDKFDFQLLKFDMIEAAINITELLKSSADAKGVKLYHKVERYTYVLGDEYMINTVLRNLVSNAIKFSNKDGEVLIYTKEEDDFIKIYIKDQGIGIEPEMLSRLFNLDRGESRPGTNNEKGTGIGLILSKEMVNKMGGEIYVESQLGKGSTFWFTLPKYKD